MAKSCPTLSSVDILRRAFSAHFLPLRSRWMGPGCRKRSLVLSLSLFFARQGGAATSSAIKRKCRSMLHDDNKLGAALGGNRAHFVHESNRAGLDLLLDHRQGLGLDRRIVPDTG